MDQGQNQAGKPKNESDFFYQFFKALDKVVENGCESCSRNYCPKWDECMMEDES